MKYEIRNEKKMDTDTDSDDNNYKPVKFNKFIIIKYILKNNK